VLDDTLRPRALGCVVLAGLLTVVGCGGGHVSSAPPTKSTPNARLLASVERALRRNPNQAASYARCRTAPAGEVRHAPFGNTRRPVLRCLIKLGGAPLESYDVQVLANGCFVGERLPPGRADSGCGALVVP